MVDFGFDLVSKSITVTNHACPLEDSSEGSRGFTCDGCKKSLIYANGIFLCKKHDFTLCKYCVDKYQKDVETIDASAVNTFKL